MFRLFGYSKSETKSSQDRIAGVLQSIILSWHFIAQKVHVDPTPKIAVVIEVIPNIIQRRVQNVN